jgi:taurine transport system permease protein
VSNMYTSPSSTPTADVGGVGILNGPPARTLNLKVRSRNWWISAGTAIVLLGIWELTTSMGWISPSILPSIQKVWATFIELNTQGYQGVFLYQDILVSLERCAIGFGGAIIVGVPLGLAMGISRRSDSSLGPIIEFLRPLPPLGYYTLLVIWFGIGNTSKDMLLFLCSMPIIAIGTSGGVRAVENDVINVAACLGLSRWRIAWSILLPASLPGIFTAFRIGLSTVFGTLVAAELVAANSGIGWLIVTAGDYVQTSIVFVGVIVIGLIAVVCDRGLVLIQTRVVRWEGQSS